MQRRHTEQRIIKHTRLPRSVPQIAKMSKTYHTDSALIQKDKHTQSTDEGGNTVLGQYTDNKHCRHNTHKHGQTQNEEFQKLIQAGKFTTQVENMDGK